MHNLPVISIIIPAYNAEKTILQTIASVQQQTFSNFELIVINDGSTDRTLELLHSITDERLKIFSYENGGLPVARNRGISHATGEFIAFLDADDLWTPDKLELQLAALQQHPEAGVAYSWTYFMDDKGESLSPGEATFLEGNVYAQLLVNNFLASGSNPLISRQAIESIGGFDSAFPHCADWDYWLRLAASWHFVVVRKHQILYRQSRGGMSSKIDGIEKQQLIMIEKVYRTAPQELQYLKNHSLAWVYRYCAEKYLQHSTNNISDVNRAGQELWRAIRLEPKILLERYTQNLIKWVIKRWVLIRLASLNYQSAPRTTNKV
ncbi:family 2 glycosyl transferase [Calothrix sp. NIES-4071]|nr:family 2 glycosyl transferase [Calothrix sp. NIES-4071]BAZ59452.1 family 2 glycosyl transferase [Calothrix sp. NIES-4105]